MVGPKLQIEEGEAGAASSVGVTEQRQEAAVCSPACVVPRWAVIVLITGVRHRLIRGGEFSFDLSFFSFQLIFTNKRSQITRMYIRVTPLFLPSMAKRSFYSECVPIVMRNSFIGELGPL